MPPEIYLNCHRILMGTALSKFLRHCHYNVHRLKLLRLFCLSGLHCLLFSPYLLEKSFVHRVQNHQIIFIHNAFIMLSLCSSCYFNSIIDLSSHIGLQGIHRSINISLPTGISHRSFIHLYHELLTCSIYNIKVPL